MAAPSFRSSTNATGTGTSMSANAPAAVVNTDFQIMVTYLASNETVTTPSGWTKLGTVSGTTSSRVHVFWAVGPTSAVSVTKSGSSRHRIVRAAYSNHGGVLSDTFGGVEYTTSGTTAAIMATTTTGIDALVIGGSEWVGASTATSTPPGGWTERLDTNTGSPDFLGATLADTWVPTPATVNATFTWNTASATRSAWAVALQSSAPMLSGSSTTATAALSAGAGAKAAADARPTAADPVLYVSGRKQRTLTATTTASAESTVNRIRPDFTVASAQSAVTGVKQIATTRTTAAAAVHAFTAEHHTSATIVHALNPQSTWPVLNHATDGGTLTTNVNVRNLLGAYIGGGSIRMPPHYDSGDLVEYVPPTTGDLRYIAQDIRTGAIRHWDLPLSDVQITYNLSGPCVLKGTIGPEVRDPAEIGLDAWATFIHVEVGGVIRASVIVQPLSVADYNLEIEGVGFTAYPSGIPFMGALSAIRIDAAEIVRRIWQHVQYFSDGDINVTVDSTNTGRLVGDPAYYEYDLDPDGYQQYAEVGFDLPTGTNYDATRIVLYKASVPAAVWNWLVEGGYGVWGFGDAAEMYPTVTDLIYSKVANGWLIASSHPKLRFVEAKPYLLNWFDDKDCAAEIDNMARQVPFDYIEQVKWNWNQTEVDRFLAIKYPRAGRKRDDLRFAEDENLLQAVLARETIDQYASVVIFRGAGTGRDGVRGFAATTTIRLRRVVVVTDKRVTSSTMANALAAEELRRRMAIVSVSEIVVDAGHPNAPLGSWELGDDILIEANMPYIGKISLYHRIVSYTWDPQSDAVRMQVRRSDQWAYGRVT